MKAIELIGAGFINKGAELMFHSIRVIFEEEKEIKFVLPAFSKQISLINRQKNCVLTKLSVKNLPKIMQKLAPILLSSKWLEEYGIVRDDEIDGIIDISGFKYSDMFSITDIERNVVAIENCINRGNPCVLMPQAFGPFHDKRRRQLVRRLIDSATLIYARDSISFTYLNDIMSSNKIKMAPDFTCKVEPRMIPHYDQYEGCVCVVPNIKVVEKINNGENKYTKMLESAIEFLKSNNVKSFFLIHEGMGDLSIAKEINTRLLEPLDIVVEDDVQVAKGIICRSLFLIASRYHAIISSLYHGVPVACIGWSHKYSELLSEYGIGDYNINIDSNDNEVLSVIESLLDNKDRDSLSKKIKGVSMIRKKEIDVVSSQLVNMFKYNSKQ